jgi:hypothetical protein
MTLTLGAADKDNAPAIKRRRKAFLMKFLAFE